MNPNNLSNKALELIQILKNTFSINYPQALRITNQKNLKQYEQLPDFIQYLKQIIIGYEEYKIKMAASVSLSNYIKSILKKQNQNQIINNLGFHFLQLLKFTYPHNLKRYLLNIFNIVISNKKGAMIKRDLQNKFLELLFNQIGTQAERFDDMNYKMIVQLGQLIGNNLNDDISGYQLIQKSFEKIVQLNWRIFTKNQKDPNNYNVQLLQEYIQLLVLYTKKVNLQKNVRFIKELFNHKLQQLIWLILNRIKKSNYKQQYHINDNDNDYNLEKSISIIKNGCIVIVQTIIKNLIKIITQISFLNTNPFFIKSINFFQLAIQILAETIYNYSLSEIFKLKHQSQLCISILNLLNTMIQVPYYYNFFFKMRKIILAQIIIPILQLTDSQKHSYDYQAQQFISSIYFIFGKQIKSSDKTKSQEKMQQIVNQKQQDDFTIQAITAKLLQTYCRYQDGYLGEVISNSLAFLTDLSFQDKSLYADQIIQNLLILIILTYRTKQRNEILHDIKKYIEKQCINFERQANTLNQKIQRALKLVLLYRYTPYLDLIDPQFVVSISFKLSIEILEGKFLTYRQQSLQIISLDILNCIFTVNQLAIFQNSAKILNILNTIILQIDITNKIYDTLLQLFRQNSERLIDDCPQSIILCVRQLVLIIKSQAIKKNNSQIKINKCWNILKLISQQSCFVKILDILQKEISSLFLYLSEPQKIQFEQDIIVLVCSFIKLRKNINKIQFQVFQLFPKVFIKFKCCFAQLFEAINLYLLYGSNFIKQSIPAINLLLQMAFQALYAKDIIADESNHCQGALILQNIISNCGQILSNQCWIAIIQNTYQRLNLKNIKSKFLSANLSIVLALSLIKCYKILAEASKIQLIIQTVLNNSHNCIDDHTSKIYVLTLNQWLKIYDCIQININYTKILDSVVTTLKNKYLRKKLEHDLDQRQQIQQAYQISLTNLNSPLQKFDQYNSFRMTIQQLRIKNINNLQQSYNQLAEEKKEFIRTILQMVKIQDTHRPIFQVKRKFI